jgi:glycosyltransferase involved in cell wall biosynthesis
MKGKVLINGIQRPLNIAFLGNQIAWGGGAKSLLLLIKSIYGYDFNLFLFVTNISSYSMKVEFEKYVNSVKLVKLPEVVGAQNESLEENKACIIEDLLDIKSIKLFAEELNNLKIDILHINNSVFSPVYKTIKTITNVKIVTHIREWIHWNGILNKQKYIIQNIKEYSDSVICISKTEAEVFADHPNLKIIPNPFDFKELELFNMDKNSIKKKIGLDPDAIIIGMMSSLMENKGVLDFLRAADFIKKTTFNIPKIKFVFLGHGLPTRLIRLKAKFKTVFGKRSFLMMVYNFINEKNLNDCVLFLSKREAVLELVNCFDIAVRPSYSGDPWGRDIIEYMALKKPVIATGISDFFIVPEKTGFLIPVHDYKKLAEKIIWLLKNEKEKSEMGNTAYGIIYEKCNLDVFRENLFNVYKSILIK